MAIRHIPNLEWPRNFKDWTSLKARNAFGLTPKPNLPAFVGWSSARHSMPQPHQALIESLRLELLDYHLAWNEIELMMQFVGPLLKYVSFQGQHYGIFFQRPLKANVSGLKIGGIVDSVVAFGYDEPVLPYFLLKEYKKSQGYDTEPFGQLLASMVAAQQLNGDGQPLYGCYVIGKIWTFVYLERDAYATTQSYDATDEGELQIIWSMLVEVKRIVEERVERLVAG